MLKLFCLLLLLPHGDLEERIAKLTDQISQEPDNAELYVKRAELYFQHEDYRFSKDDLLKAAILSDDIANLDYLIARSMHALTELDSALVYINNYLGKTGQTPHNDAVSLKGEILSGMGDYLEAAHAYEWCTTVFERPAPDLFINAAEAHLQSGVDGKEDEAIRVIRQGQIRLGDLIVFDKKLIEIYVRQENYTAAINIQSGIIERSRRKAQFYSERAQLYYLNGNKSSALQDLELAVADIQRQPPHIRNNKSSTTLMMQIQELKELWK